MKKTVFLLALILPVCSLIAQPPTPVVDFNVALIDQVGDDNSADVTQDGLNNYTWVSTDGNLNAESFVVQTGGRNYTMANQFGDGNSFDVTQKNAEKQPGNLNSAWVEQGTGPWGPGNDNSAKIVQTVKQSPDYPNASGILDARVFQDGDGNESGQYQKGMRDLAVVVQNGTNGKAVQRQGTSQYADGHAFASVAGIWQTQTANNARARQHQIGLQNVAGAIQGTDNSVALQVQVSESHIPVTDPLKTPNVAGIAQLENAAGDKGNKAMQVQYYDNMSTYGNVAGVIQMGGHNTSVQLQAGGLNVSATMQDGDGNIANVYQSKNGAVLPAGLPVSF